MATCSDQLTTSVEWARQTRLGLTKSSVQVRDFLSLCSTVASILGFFITCCFIKGEDTVSAPALPALSKFCFQLRK